MAYMTQVEKKRIKIEIDKNLEEAGMTGRVKYTLGVRHGSVLVVNIKSSDIDLIANANAREGVKAINQGTEYDAFNLATRTYLQVNEFWYQDHFTGAAKRMLAAIIDGANDGNHNNSDIQSDYFDVGWYLNVNIGQYDKPFVVTEKKVAKKKIVKKVSKFAVAIGAIKAEIARMDDCAWSVSNENYDQFAGELDGLHSALKILEGIE
mgnify:CR=1 FL=1|jgi:hypothetical protein